MTMTAPEWIPRPTVDLESMDYQTRAAIETSADYYEPQLAALRAENERLREALGNLAQECEHLSDLMSSAKAASAATIDAWRCQVSAARAAFNHAVANSGSPTG